MKTVRVACRGVRRGLSSAENGLFIDNKNKLNKPKIPRKVKTGQLAGLARPDQHTTGEHTMTNWHGTANTMKL